MHLNELSCKIYWLKTALAKSKKIKLTDCFWGISNKIEFHLFNLQNLDYDLEINVSIYFLVNEKFLNFFLSLSNSNLSAEKCCLNTMDR